MQKKVEIVEKGMRIRFATEEDLPRISLFIRDYWDEKYSYATHPQLLEYIHKKQDEVWYVVLENEDGSELLGTCGYLLCNQLKQADVAVCLLKVKKEVNGLMGVKMLWFINQNVPNRFTYNCGLRTNTFGIYQFLQWHVFKLNHYYRIADKESYRICKINDKKIAPVLDSNVKLVELVTFAELIEKFDVTRLQNLRPYKDDEYIKWRYYEMPYYKYRVWGVVEDEYVNALLVGREISYLDTKMLAIVDYIGEEKEFSKISYAVQILMDEQEYEYVECFNYGFSEETMWKGGFVMRTDDDPNVLPSHFEPFEQSNVEDYFFTTSIENLRVFRADGNHDVPRYVQYIPL